MHCAAPVTAAVGSSLWLEAAGTDSPWEGLRGPGQPPGLCLFLFREVKHSSPQPSSSTGTTWWIWTSWNSWMSNIFQSWQCVMSQPSAVAYLGVRNGNCRGRAWIRLLDPWILSLQLCLSLLLAVSPSPDRALLLTGSSFSAATVGKIRNEK